LSSLLSVTEFSSIFIKIASSNKQPNIYFEKSELKGSALTNFYEGDRSGGSGLFLVLLFLTVNLHTVPSEFINTSH